MIEWLLVALAGAVSGAAWWWFEGSLQRDCRRLLGERDAAQLEVLEQERAAQ